MAAILKYPSMLFLLLAKIICYSFLRRQDLAVFVEEGSIHLTGFYGSIGGMHHPFDTFKFRTSAYDMKLKLDR